MDIESPVRTLHGVGPKKAEALAGFGVRSIKDLLFLFPRRYEDRRRLVPLSELKVGETAAVIAEVFSVSTPGNYNHSGTPCSALLTDGENTVRAVWFNPFATRTLRPGMRVALYGRVEFFGGIQLNNPEIEILINSNTGQDQESQHIKPQIIGQIMPFYPATARLPQKFLKELIKQTLDDWIEKLVDFLPESIKNKYSMKSLSEAVLELHRPQNPDSWLRARNRLAFDELFLLQVGLLIRRQRINNVLSNVLCLTPGNYYSRFHERLSFPLTNAQSRTISEILNDLQGPLPMNRLLQGDVGSGKTIVAVAALLTATDSGSQAAFMVPTSILAQQHFIKISALLEPLGVKTVLLTGGLRVTERRAVLSDIYEGRAQIIIGTHALFTEEVKFHNLGLVIVDEQHRFGVMQRNALMSKGIAPHTLIMTATPIPRTLVLSVYGDLAVSLLDEMPPGRKPVKTSSITPDNDPDVLDRIRKRVQMGQQVYWVCPLIENESAENAESVEDENTHEEKGFETGELSAVKSSFERLSTALPNVRIEMLHGRMSVAEKAQIMHRFNNGEIDVLVATVVIEVGVDVPNATLMVIEDAGRFGLAQLHQLRGRVGRGSDESECLLLFGNSPTHKGMQRIATMVRTSDGFALADADLQMRGPGEVCGIRQHGVTDFRVADLSRDLKILELARKEAQLLLSKDPELQNEPILKAELVQRFGSGLELAGIA